MSVLAFFKCKKTISRLHEGPLGLYMGAFAALLVTEGHCYQSGARNIRVAADYSAWLAINHLSVNDVNEDSISKYEQFRQQHRRPFLSDHAALIRLLRLLRGINATTPVAKIVLQPLAQIESDFEQYLRQNYGHCETSVIRHRTPLRKFLQQCCPAGVSDFASLSGTDIRQFLVQHAHDQSPSSAKNMCWTLRSFSRYLLYKGYTTCDLSCAVPSIRTWSLTALPGHLSEKQIEKVLNTCDRKSAVGMRDYAVLMLLSRLGLRANEIVLLKLDDVNWHAGSLNIRGKGRTLATLPLLPEAGAALSDYLQKARPKTDSRSLFVSTLAPHSHFSSSAGISGIATSALNRAKVTLERKGAHVFRHSLATNLLQAGATLAEIGQVLRHKSHDTTRIYAKVDIGGLRALAMPWQGFTQ
jgi:site-specific recombinase XerD